MSALKTVFSTGASRGIGHATAKYLVDQGWRAITCSRDQVPPECARSDRHSHITADLAEVEHLVAPGEIEPDAVHTPGIFVRHILKGDAYERRVEKRTVRSSHG